MAKKKVIKRKVLGSVVHVVPDKSIKGYRVVLPEEDNDELGMLVPSKTTKGKIAALDQEGDEIGLYTQAQISKGEPLEALLEHWLEYEDEEDDSFEWDDDDEEESEDFEEEEEDEEQDDDDESDFEDAEAEEEEEEDEPDDEDEESEEEAEASEPEKSVKELEQELEDERAELRALVKTAKEAKAQAEKLAEKAEGKSKRTKVYKEWSKAEQEAKLARLKTDDQQAKCRRLKVALDEALAKDDEGLKPKKSKSAEKDKTSKGKKKKTSEFYTEKGNLKAAKTKEGRIFERELKKAQKQLKTLRDEYERSTAAFSDPLEVPCTECEGYKLLPDSPDEDVLRMLDCTKCNMGWIPTKAGKDVLMGGQAAAIFLARHSASKNYGLVQLKPLRQVPGGNVNVEQPVEVGNRAIAGEIAEQPAKAKKGEKKTSKKTKKGGKKKTSKKGKK